jgi:hypothetical protein
LLRRLLFLLFLPQLCHIQVSSQIPDLPTFNSHAIEANIHRIPGLSDSFIAMNDDFFLTAPWHLADFVHEDGSEVSCMQLFVLCVIHGRVLLNSAQLVLQQQWQQRRQQHPPHTWPQQQLNSHE